MSRIWILVLLLSVKTVLQVEARYRLEVRVLHYNNPNNQDWDGGCCEFGLICSDPCDVTFFLCLRNYGFNPPNNDYNCPLGRQGSSNNPVPIHTSRQFIVGQNIGGVLRNPVVFTGNNWPGRFQLMMRIDDYDPLDADDLLDRVVVNRIQAPGNSFSPILSQRGIYGKVTMQFSFKVSCETNYYGSDCARHCVPQDSDTLGHYTCDGNGNRVCRTGYTGADCVTAICSNDCVQGSCSRPGLCDICDSGWSGPLCGECQLPAGCHSERAHCNEPGQCICNEGYSGSLCQNDDDVCRHQTPCRNGGTCSNGGSNLHSCLCPVGYTGTNCETPNFCASSPCLNAGSCEVESGSFNCTCSLGWAGSTCNENIDECSMGSPCQNGGSCADCIPTNAVVTPINSPTRPCPLGYTCACPAGFFGDNCEADVDYCSSSPCENGGTCHDVVGGPGYSCTCPEGYSGTDCQTEVDLCEPEPCQNGGTCQGGLGMGFSCICPPGLTGDLCQMDIDECQAFPCNPNTTFQCVNMMGSYVCQCNPGYTGQDCGEDLDECAAMPCANGRCFNLVEDFRCECSMGFTGTRCDVNIDDCHPDLCLFGGTCVDKVDGYSCSCAPGHTGSQCEMDVDLCSPNPCGQNMVCLENDQGGFQCTPCQPGEAGCSGSSLPQGGNGTHPNAAPSSKVVGGAVGGVIAAVALIILLIVLVCCCYRYQCCCCHGGVKEEEEETEIDSRYQQDIAQNNPLYFGVSTLVSSSGTMQSSMRPNTGETMAPSPQHHYYNTFDSGNPTDPDSHHYEHIPAQFANGTATETNQAVTTVPQGYKAPRVPASSESPAALKSGKYDKLNGQASSDTAAAAAALKSGKYDKLEKTNQPTTEENPYIMTPNNPHVREDMFLLPPPAELKKMADMQEEAYM